MNLRNAEDNVRGKKDTFFLLDYHLKAILVCYGETLPENGVEARKESREIEKKVIFMKRALDEVTFATSVRGANNFYFLCKFQFAFLLLEDNLS